MEIYRPSKSQDTVLYFPIDSKRPVLSPHTPQRVHGFNYPSITNQSVPPPAAWDRDQTISLSLRGTLTGGDVYVYTRYMMQVFPCESMWYSDFFNSRDISIGLPNIINPTRGAQLWVMFAPFFIPIFAYLACLLFKEKWIARWRLSILLSVGFVLLLWGFSWLYAWLVNYSDPALASQLLQSQGLSSFQSLFAAATLRRLSYLGGLLTPQFSNAEVALTPRSVICSKARPVAHACASASVR